LKGESQYFYKALGLLILLNIYCSNFIADRYKINFALLKDRKHVNIKMLYFVCLVCHTFVQISKFMR